MGSSNLDSTAPVLHRGAYWYASRRFRRAPSLWRVIERLQPLQGKQILHVGGFSLHMNTEDRGEAAWYRGTKEQMEMALVRHLVRNGDRCIDLGANLGMYTALFASLVGQRGFVTAYEPAPWMIDRLSRHFHDLPNVCIRPVAAGSSFGVASLNRPHGHDGMASLREFDAGNTMERIEVPVRALDDEDISSDVHFLKVDAEGWEAEIFRGCRARFGRREIRASLWEVSPGFGNVSYVEEMSKNDAYVALRIDKQRVNGGIRFGPRLLRITRADVSNLGQFSMLYLRRDAIKDVAPFLE